MLLRVARIACGRRRRADLDEQLGRMGASKRRAPQHRVERTRHGDVVLCSAESHLARRFGEERKARRSRERDACPRIRLGSDRWPSHNEAPRHTRARINDGANRVFRGLGQASDDARSSRCHQRLELGFPRLLAQHLDGLERLAKARIHMRRPGCGPERARHGLSGDPLHGAERDRRGIRQAELGLMPRVGAKELGLIDCLRSRSILKLPRPVGGDGHDRDEGHRRLDEGRQVVRASAARRADENRRHPRTSRLPECEERRGALIDHHIERDARLARECDRERRRARSGGEHRVAHARIRKGRNEEARPRHVQVRAHASAPRAFIIGRCFADASAISRPTSEPFTMPTPA